MTLWNEKQQHSAWMISNKQKHLQWKYWQFSIIKSKSQNVWKACKKYCKNYIKISKNYSKKSQLKINSHINSCKLVSYSSIYLTLFINLKK